ncbi:PP2C family protein-serine/threonine phosphatase [Streptomyces sp. NPDC059468]|uniref:PP2C family protein-serine/threonine phosphatase n=1 Tax=Streptomyces sp. NPDC059468 TaxID=3346845 RepID=UPI0036C30F74
MPDIHHPCWSPRTATPSTSGKHTAWLLGVDPHAERPSACLPLPEGSTLLLYTDGLIERRGESMDHGMTRLRQHAAALVGQDLDELSDELMNGLVAGARDDIALLALRLSRPGDGGSP